MNVEGIAALTAGSAAIGLGVATGVGALAQKLVKRGEWYYSNLTLLWQGGQMASNHYCRYWVDGSESREFILNSLIDQAVEKYRDELPAHVGKGRPTVTNWIFDRNEIKP